MWIRRIFNAFKERLSDLKDLENDFATFSNPFSVIAEKVLQDYQMQLIELQCNSVLNSLAAGLQYIRTSTSA